MIPRAGKVNWVTEKDVGNIPSRLSPSNYRYWGSWDASNPVFSLKSDDSPTFRLVFDLIQRYHGLEKLTELLKKIWETYHPGYQPQTTDIRDHAILQIH